MLKDPFFSFLLGAIVTIAIVMVVLYPPSFLKIEKVMEVTKIEEMIEISWESPEKKVFVPNLNFDGTISTLGSIDQMKIREECTYLKGNLYSQRNKITCRLKIPEYSQVSIVLTFKIHEGEVSRYPTPLTHKEPSVYFNMPFSWWVITPGRSGAECLEHGKLTVNGKRITPHLTENSIFSLYTCAYQF